MDQDQFCTYEQALAMAAMPEPTIAEKFSEPRPANWKELRHLQFHMNKHHSTDFSRPDQFKKKKVA